MAMYEHISSFAGKEVVDWEPGQSFDDPSTTIPRISLSYEAVDEGATWLQHFDAFMALPKAQEISGLVIGTWDASGAMEDSSETVIQALVANHERLPHLRAIFFGDIISEECEISWIQQTDHSPLFAAFPELEHFTVRGGTGLRFGRLRLKKLQSLVVQTGGLDAEVIREILAARLPALTHLELWLGTENYGWNGSISDVESLIAGKHFPQLRYLGLRDSEIADEIAAALAPAPILERIEVLDLSLGTLSDTGAEALVNSPAVSKLQRLDIHYHFCTPDMVAQIEALGIEVDASDPQEPDEYDGELSRYVAVGE